MFIIVFLLFYLNPWSIGHQLRFFVVLAINFSISLELEPILFCFCFFISVFFLLLCLHYMFSSHDYALLKAEVLVMCIFYALKHGSIIWSSAMRMYHYFIPIFSNQCPNLGTTFLLMYLPVILGFLSHIREYARCYCTVMCS